ncbi:tetratricopeptide repeat protein, partial [Nodularia spumigena]|uniref:tetratricopeptide repeat protein n=1 Tax=Nodularia spumigena TaxID=70799 RepID=UPI00232F88A0
LQTTDNKTYTAKIIPNPNLENLDLALIEFQSNQNYCLRQITSIIPNLETPVIAAGYSIDKQQIVYRTGTVQQIPETPLKEGYQIGYTSDIEQGMSGGTIINSRGEIIGINGKSAYPIMNTGFTYSDGTKPTQTQIQKMRTVSWGIPVSTFLAQVNQQTLTAYSLPLPKVRDSIPPTQLIGWLKEIEQKAQQITVKIQNKSGGNGSGFIIAREGNTYTVLTSAHVFSAPNDPNKICTNCEYEIIAVNGQAYPVDKSTIQVEIGVDLAVVKFTATEQNYQVATLANYNPNNDDYIFSAGYPKLGNNSPWRFTMGRILEKDTGLLRIRQSDFQTNNSSGLQTATSLTGGYELVYTSITYGGMSGGPVLDSLGRVIGIHGRAEAEEALDQNTGDCGNNVECQVQLGYSLGIPVSTFLGLSKRLGTPAPKVENNRALQLNAQQVKSIQDAILSVNISQGNTTASQWLERGNQLWRLRRHSEAVKAFEQAIEQKPSFVYLAYYGKGLALGSDKKYPEAIAALEQAVKTNPDFVAAWQILSLSHRTFNQFEQALVAIETAIQKQPKNPNLYNEKWGILYDLKRYVAAEAAINEAIKLSPRAAFYHNRGILYSEQKKWELALADYNQALQINPEAALPYNNRAILYSEQKKWELALADYTKAIQINPEYAQAYYNRAILYYEQKKWELALADYNQAIQINPEYGDAYNNRGVLYKEQKKWELALADYNQAIQINPVDADAYNNRGNLYKEQKNWELALADYNQAIQINQEDALPYTNRGLLYKEQKKWELALADYTQAIQINPEYADAYNNRGNLYQEQKKWELALADYTKAIQINPEYAQAYYNRGVLYYEQKKWELALADFTKAIQINPEDAKAYSNRGVLYKEQKKWELALADYNQAIQINPEDAKAYSNRGNLYSLQQKWELALADYTKAIDINPELADAYYNRGNLYSEQKKWELALADYNQAIQINPEFANAYTNRGNLYFQQRKWELALADFTKSIDIEPENANAYNLRGIIYREQKKWELALADHTKAIQINPEFANAYRNRGIIYREQEKWELALADFTKSIDIEPENANAYNLRGILYSLQQKWELALADFTKSIDIDPEYANAYNLRGLVYERMGNKQKAIENYQQAAQLFQAQGNTAAYEQAMNVLKDLQR